MTRDIRESVSLEQRLENGERENRRFKVLGSLVLLGMAGALCMGLTSAPSKKLEAEVLVLKNAQGKSQMILGAGDDGPALTILDKNGKLRVNLGVGQDGPALDLLDAAENPRAQLMITEDQGPLLNFYDAKGSQVSLKP
ncbi:MAG TPA: hypothetical protein VJX91_02290 [Candidatus Eisenbacteria bacterium]|nr:hypothetical protein [Candidatus Eisenbacteria bacterium]